MKPFYWSVRVYYQDTDAGGVVYHASYLNFFERARTEMLRNKGFELDRLAAEQKLIFAVRSMHIEYIEPARFNELLEVSAEIVLAKKVSLNFEQVISRDGIEICKGKVRIACLDTETLKPKILPEYFLQLLSL